MNNLPTAQPTSRAALLQLAQRCEAASGPDRELDAEIAEAYKDAPDRLRVYLPAPRYTASIDCALSLVPEGCFLEQIIRDPEGEWCPLIRRCWNDGGQPLSERYEIHHNSMALALCAAALKARAALA